MKKYTILGDLITPAKVVRCRKGNYPVLSMTMHDGIVLQSDRFKKSLASADQSDYKVVEYGKLVIGFPIDEGVLYIQKVAPEGIMSPAYSTWDVDTTRINPDFLELCLHSPQSMQYYKDKLRSTTARRRSIPTADLLALRIRTPDMESQFEAVAVARKVDEMIAIRHAQATLLDQLVKSRFIELFGDPVYNSNGLPTMKLCELGSLDRGRSQHRPRNAPELLNGPYPLIQTGEVASAGLYITGYQNTYSELGLRQSKMWKAGTLCITIAANIAQTAILTFDACFPDSVVGFIPNDAVSAIYMHYWFGFFQKILEEQAPQVAQKNINLKILADLDVMVPDQTQQEQFAAFVAQTDKSKLAVQQGLKELEILKKSLMQQYFG